MAMNEEVVSANSNALIWSLAGGVALAIPIGYLLAYLAALPLFMGLFFFLLLGLLIGAVMFRLGKAAAPAPRQNLWYIGLAVAVLCWLTGHVAEYRWLPADAAEAVLRNSVTQSVSPERIKLFELEIHKIAADRIRTFSPGGLLGYWRWRATDGTLELPRIGNDPPYTWSLREKGVIWVVRVALSLVLVSFTLLSQFLSLAKSPSGIDATDDALP
jgi:hypothetical protein